VKLFTVVLDLTGWDWRAPAPAVDVLSHATVMPTLLQGRC